MSSLDLENVSGVFEQSVERTGEHGALSPAEVLLAQASDAVSEPAASGEPVPVDVDGGLPAADVAGSASAETPTEYAADANNVVRLPANVSTDNIRVSGADLVLEQADGTVITIKDAASDVPTFILGEVEVPRVAVLAALEASGVDVAFGLDGSITAGAGSALPGSSGGNFQVPPGGIGDGFDLSELLPPTALQFERLEARELNIGLEQENSNDGPVANADTNWAQEDGASAAGNVLQTLAHNGAPSGVFGDVADTDLDLDTLTVTNVQDGDSGPLAVGGGTTSATGTAIVGLYGTLTIGADGSYSYAVDNANAAVQGLDDGETLVDNAFTYTVTDGTTTTTATLTITVFGSNDGPVANADTNWAQEDGASAAGNVLQTLAHNGAPSGVFGDVADTDLDLDTLTVTNVQDGDSGPLAVGGGTTSATGTAIVGLYGTLTIGADGSYSYAVDNANAAVQGLDDGETLVDNAFTYTVTDGTTTTTATLTITVFGSNDGPVANADTNWAQEDGASAAGNVLQTLAHNGAPSGVFGDVADTDLDLDTLTVTNVQDGDSGPLAVGGGTTSATGTAIVGLYGTLTIGADGSYSYAVDNANAAVQGLDDGETLVDNAFTYTVTDGTTTTTATLTITVFGSNDGPVANADTNWAQEDGASAAGNVLQTLAHNGAPSGVFGDVADTDLDLDTLTVTNVQDGDSGPLAVGGGTTSATGTAIVGLYGTLTIGADGSYSYAVDNANAAVQGLDDGETLVDNAFTYTVTDGTTTTTATLTITVFGSNDGPVANADTNWAQEDGASAAGNVLQTLAHNGAPSGVFGDVADTDLDLDTLTVTNVQDGDSGPLAVGGGTTSATGTAIVGLYGTLTIGADGSYSYAVDNANAAVQGLDDGETLVDNAFTYTVTDGTTTTTATLTITVFGSNDGPVANADTNWAQEDGASAAGNVLQTLAHNGAPSGVFGDVADTDLDLDTLTVTNVQDGDSGPLAVGGGTTSATGTAIVGLYGTLTIGADGSYSYAVDNANAAVQGLDDGETLVDNAFTYTVTDGTTTTTATLTITVFGSNDGPVANADTNWAQEDGASAAGNVLQTLAHNGAPSGVFGDVADTDLDLDTLTVTNVQDGDSGPLAVGGGTTSATGTAIVGLYGTLTIGADGSYSYAVDNANAAVQGLDDGETLVDNAFTYTVTDGTTTTTATLTITVFGSNDGPVANADTNWAQEDGASAAGNVLQTLAHNGAPSGVFGDVADTDLDLDTLTVTNVQDGDSGPLAVGGGTTSATGTAIVGLYGTLTIGADGSYSYAVDNANAAVQGLDDGETLVDNAFTYTVTDGTTTTTATLTITVFGSNDGPVANADTNWAQEDGASAAGNVLQTLAHNGAPSGVFGDVADTDLDLDTLTVTNVQDGDSGPLAVGGGTTSATGTAIVGLYGTLTIGADGSYSYAVDNANAAVQGLDDGETLVDNAFTYTVTDGTTTTTATLTITVFGSNDGPVANADTNWAQEDGASAAGNVLQTLAHNGAPSGVFGDVADTDLDLDTLTVTNVQDGDSGPLAVGGGTTSATGTAIVGLYGTLTIGADGSYSYAVDNANAAVQGLDDGETLVDNAFTYTVTDGTTTTTATLTITVFGSNDGPVANADTNWAQEDGASAAGNVLQTLAHNGAPSGVFGDVADTDLDLDTLTVTNVQDGDSGPLAVGGGTTSATGTAIVGLYGTLTIGADGSYSYAVDNANAAVQGLDDGETLVDNAFTYTVTDGTTTTTATLTITVFGSNDGPVANADTNWAQEDGASAAGNVLQTLAHNGAPSGVFGDVADTDLDLDTLTVTNVQDGDSGPLAVGGGTTSATGTAIVGLYGTLTIGADGSYSYAVDNANAAVQGLDDGETLVDNAFTYTVTDGTTTTTATLTITVFGSNDGPVANADTNWAQEDGASAAGNVLQTLAHNGAPSGVFGDVADTDLDLDTLTVTNVQDGDSGPLAVGGGTTSATGTAIVGLYGTLTIGADGSYSYAVDNANAAVQGLDDGETLVDNAFTYTVTDGTTTTTATLTITVFGSNDGPVANADINWAQEDGASAAGNVLQTLAHNGAPSGVFGDVADTDLDLDTLTVTNVQDGDSGPLAVGGGTTSATGTAIVGLYGTLTIGADGSYSYAVDNANAAVQGLDDGETLVDNAFTYTVTDGTTTTTATLTITVFGSNDGPVANADTNWAQEDGASAAGNVLQTLAHNGAPSGVFGDVADTDLDLDTLTVTNVQDGDSGPLAVGGGTTSATGTAIVGLYGTLTIGADGSYSYAVDNANAAVQGLDDGETLVDNAFTYTVTDGTTTTTATLTITVFGSNDGPVAANTHNWMPSDPAEQTASTPAYPNGYPLMVSVPTDVDGDNLVVTAAGTVPTGVFYFDGMGYVALTSGTVLYDPSNGTNLLDDLVYRPTASTTDTINTNLTLNVSDGTTTVQQTVGLHEVVQNHIPIGSFGTDSGNSPLTSGNSQTTTQTISQSQADSINNNIATLTVLVSTDFQQTNIVVPVPGDERDVGTAAGNARETEVSVFLNITQSGVTTQFVIVADDDPGSIVQSWFYNPTTGLMEANVNASQVFVADGSGNPTAVSLATWLAANPIEAGDTWNTVYDDDNGGNFQARRYGLEIFPNDPADPGIIVNGDALLADQIYGGSGADNLSGNGGDDVIVGRGNNDTLNGGSGNDIIFGGGGIDLLFGGDGIDLLDGGLGSDRMTGGSGADTFVIDPDSLSGGIADYIADYNLAEGDVIDLSNLFQSLGVGAPVDAAGVADVVSLTNDGTNTTLFVDSNGTSGGGSPEAVATLAGVYTTVSILFDDSEPATPPVS